MRIALVHDYLMQDGGAERVLLAFHRMFPDAPIFTLFHDPKRMHPGFADARIIPSSLNDLPFARSHYEWYLPFMPHAIESFDLSRYDLVLSSTSSIAKGVIAAPGAIHICYCHTPTRFLWEARHTYIHDLPQPSFIKRLLPLYLHHLRKWDVIASQRPDIVLTNSQTSRGRIKRFYRRDAEVISPPVDIDLIRPSDNHQGYWLTGGRLVAYKRFDLVVNAFNKLDLPLKIFGTGPEEEKLRALAGPKTEFVGAIDETTKFELYRNAIGFIYPHVEDFGITAIEAMAAGKPVIAYQKGGATETILEGKTGIFFKAQIWQELANAVLRFDANSFSAATIRSEAERYSPERFVAEMKRVIFETTGKTV